MKANFILLYVFVAKVKRQPAKKLHRKIARGKNAAAPVKQQQVKRPRGRVKKTKPKKAIKITGLDLLHSQTLLSTSPQGNFTNLKITYYI